MGVKSSSRGSSSETPRNRNLSALGAAESLDFAITSTCKGLHGLLSTPSTSATWSVANRSRSSVLASAPEENPVLGKDMRKATFLQVSTALDCSLSSILH